MQDHAVVAAVVAGDADGFEAVYDQYATSLYACCHVVLPEPEAAGAVLDTFLIATVKLDGLRDPDRLGPWLHAVARNECLRRLGPGQEIPPEIPAAIPAAIRAAADHGAADHGGEPPEPPLPSDLRSQVLTACADNSPAGRAHRMSVAHRAGVFGPAGFPKAMGSSGPWWWRRVRRHRGVAGAVAAVAALAVAAGITVALTAGGSHRAQASGLGLGGDAPTPVSTTSSGATNPAPSPAQTTPASTQPTSPAALVGATSAGASAGPGTAAPTASPPGTSPSPSSSPSSSPAQGYLLVAPGKLMLTSKSGTPATGSFGLTAANGPVSNYTVRVAAMPGRVTVAPAGGSLQAGGHVRVTVTVTSNAGLTTHIVVQPGNFTVTVVYKVKPQPAPKPAPPPPSKA
jgi:DNA-directed RNA polymerase specialized sigma24 family protein